MIYMVTMLNKTILIKNLWSFSSDNIWGANIVDMHIKRSSLFLLIFTDVWSKYAWIVPLKDKDCIIITDGFQKFLKESKLKPNKIWVDKDSNFYNRLTGAV